MITGELMARMQRLEADRVPFVTATVVRAAKPTSVRPGDSALVLADGSIEGFVGGVCAQASVRLHAARALETGEAVLLRLLPGAAEDAEPEKGIVVSHNPCLSGGSLEIFLEPQLAAPRIVVAGDTPIARALETVARAAGYDVLRGDAIAAEDAALVVASHGDGEEALLARALEAGISYVGLVASPRRGRAVVESLEVADALRSAVHTPAGLDIGARSPADVAISILAEIVASRTAHAPAPSGSPALATAIDPASSGSPALATAIDPASSGSPALATAIDPVCGMEVAVTEATVHADVDGARVYFCCEGCRATHLARA